MLQYIFPVSATTLIFSCFFCCLMLWIFSQNSHPKKVLGFTLIVATLYNIYFETKIMLSDNAVMEILDFSYSIFCIFLLYAAHLYFRLLMQQEKKGNKSIVLQLVYTLAVYFILYIILRLSAPDDVHLYSFSSIKENIDKPIVWLRIIAYLHYLVFLAKLCIFTVRMYQKHKKEIAFRFSYSESISLSWIPFMVGLFIVAGFYTLLDIALPKSGLNTRIVYNFGYSTFYLIIGFLGASQKDIYEHEEMFFNSPDISEIQEEQEGNESVDFPKTGNISANTRVQLRDGLKALMENDKIYLNPELRIDYVIKTLGTNRTYLFLVIKEDFNNSFIEFVNRYRIEDAKKLVADTSVNFSEIAEKVGFKSLSSFNIFFKRLTGQTPSEYRKAHFDSI